MKGRIKMAELYGIELASVEELKDYCNKVREAGGGNPLDALLPAIPQEANECLIALNLNFSCEVDGVPKHEAGFYYGSLTGLEIWNEYSEQLGYPELADSVWHMQLYDENIAKKIATNLELPIVEPKDDNAGPWRILLPARIGLIAQSFDEWLNLTPEEQELHWLNDYVEETYKDRQKELDY